MCNRSNGGDDLLHRGETFDLESDDDEELELDAPPEPQPPPAARRVTGPHLPAGPAPAVRVPLDPRRRITGPITPAGREPARRIPPVPVPRGRAAQITGPQQPVPPTPDRPAPQITGPQQPLTAHADQPADAAPAAASDPAAEMRRVRRSVMTGPVAVFNPPAPEPQQTADPLEVTGPQLPSTRGPAVPGRMAIKKQVRLVTGPHRPLVEKKRTRAARFDPRAEPEPAPGNAPDARPELDDPPGDGLPLEDNHVAAAAPDAADATAAGATGLELEGNYVPAAAPEPASATAAGATGLELEGNYVPAAASDAASAAAAGATALELEGNYVPTTAPEPASAAVAEATELELESNYVPAADTPAPAGDQTAEDRLEHSMLDLAGEDVDLESLELDAAPYAARAGAAAHTSLLGDDTPDVAPPEPSAEHVARVKEMFVALDKAAKTINLYQGKGESCDQALDLAHERVRAALSETGAVRLAVTPYELLLGEHAVYVSQEDRLGISYRLFADGVRELTILPEVTADELGRLLHTVRITPRPDGEEDAVIALWQQPLTHIHFRVFDAYLEGLVEEGLDNTQAQIEQLYRAARAPLHEQGPLQAQLPEPGPSPATLWAELQQAPVDDQLPAQLSAVQQQLWRRSFHVAAELLASAAEPAPVGQALARMITRALDRRQWSLIAEVGQVLDGVPSAQHEALSTALGAICAGDTIGQLRHHLASCSIDDFRQLLPLLRALPAAADEPLLLLLTNLPDGAVQEELAALLKARGVDLTLFYNRRLRGDDPAQIESAVKALGEIGSPQAVDACRRLLRHAEVRVRLAVLNAVGDKLRAKDIGALIGNLADNSTALRQACLELLERFPGDESSAAALLQQVKANAFDAWRKPDRQRLLQLLVRWGGPAIDPFIVQTITAANPLKRKKAAERRDEMFEAVQRVGGKRCKRLLEACLAQRRLPEKLQRGIHKVLERLQ